MNSIGEIIRKRRASMKMSQSTLADGICSQPMISRLENNQFDISFKDMLAVIGRLNMTLQDLAHQGNDNEAQMVMRRLDEAREQNDFEGIEYIITDEKDRKYWKSTIELEAYYNWHYGIIRYVIYRNGKNAMQALEKAITLSEGNDLMVFSLPEMYITKGNIYNDQHKIDLEWYKKAEILYNQSENTNFRLGIKILYNIVAVGCRIEDYEEVIKYCDIALKKLKENDSTYCICEFYYSKMTAYIQLEQSEAFLENIDWVKQLFKYMNRLELLVYLENYSPQNI